jgi:predicted amidohydrolase YtcJ
MKGKHADLVLHNGKILTMNSSDDIAASVATWGGHIAAVGSNEDIAPWLGEETEVLELDGRAVVPGFIDAHTHVELGTYAKRFWQDVRELSRLEIAAEIKKRTERLPPGKWVVAQGTFGQDLPSREELDRAAPHHPVAIRWSMHKVVANSRALRASGIDRKTPDPPGSRIERTESGEPTGVIEEGFDLLAIPRAGFEELKEALRQELHDTFLAQGITTVYELPISVEAIRAYQELLREGRLPVRLAVWYTLPPGHQPLIQMEEFEKIGLSTGFGNDWLNVGGVKIFVDGDDRAAFFSERLSGPPSEWGLLTRTYQGLVELLARACRAKLQPWIHAIGDAAQEMAIEALEQVSRMAPQHYNHRPRIEHVGNEWADLRQLPRLRALGAIPVPTAAFMYGAPDDFDAHLGPEGRAFIYRTLIDEGFQPPGNSDTAGTQPFAVNPFFGMYCMVARKNRNGVKICPQEAISAYEALRVYTTFSAYSGFHEGTRGSIQVGKLADLAVLSADPLHVAPEDLRSIRADITVLGGKIAYRRG